MKTPQRQAPQRQKIPETQGMDYGPICRLCCAPANIQVTSRCSLIGNPVPREDFITTRNNNYRHAVQTGLISRTWAAVNVIKSEDLPETNDDSSEATVDSKN